MPAVSDVLDEIMALSREDQEVLRVHLVALLDGHEMPGAGVDWESEIPRRLRRISEGSERLLDDDEVDAILDDDL